MASYKRLKYRYFFLSFAVAFLVLMVMILFMVTSIQPKARRQTESPPEPTYLPESRDSLNLLVMGTASANEAPGTYMLVRLDPLAGQIPVVVFSPATLVDNGGKTETLTEVYTFGGADYTRTVLADTLGITIDRYARITLANFIKAAKVVGNVEFTLPADISFVDSGGMSVTLQKGLQLLDGSKVASLFSHSGYDGGELARCKVAGDLTAAIINQRLDVALSTVCDQVFETVINFVDSDISYPDYEQRKAAAAYMAGLETKPAYLVPLTVQQKEDGYALTDTFIARVGQAFS